jgi:Fe-S-cluster containining protein
MGRVEPQEAYRDLEAVYADLDAELARLRPACQASGRCCRFREHGHQLWTTRLEIDYLVESEGLPTSIPDGACPYQKGGLCGVRDHRMLGCRVYFCDPAYKPHMAAIYEKYHRLIRDLHSRHGLPYHYFEVLEGLRRVTPGEGVSFMDARPAGGGSSLQPPEPRL